MANGAWLPAAPAPAPGVGGPQVTSVGGAGGGPGRLSESSIWPDPGLKRAWGTVRETEFPGGAWAWVPEGIRKPLPSLQK